MIWCQHEAMEEGEEGRALHRDSIRSGPNLPACVTIQAGWKPTVPDDVLLEIFDFYVVQARQYVEEWRILVICRLNSPAWSRYDLAIQLLFMWTPFAVLELTRITLCCCPKHGPVLRTTFTPRGLSTVEILSETITFGEAVTSLSKDYYCTLASADGFPSSNEQPSTTSRRFCCLKSSSCRSRRMC